MLQGRPGSRGPRGFPGPVGIGVKGEPGIPGIPGKPAVIHAEDGRITPNLVRVTLFLGRLPSIVMSLSLCPPTYLQNHTAKPPNFLLTLQYVM